MDKEKIKRLTATKYSPEAGHQREVKLPVAKTDIPKSNDTDNLLRNLIDLGRDAAKIRADIEENTRRTKEVSEKFLFWFITLPLIIGAIILLTQC
jgi:hypothetical protein